ncbi:hypothetical protein [Gulosibacter molinativorax]|uniref:hypothetical protein n=1 Tax=Gulosibacter molinativorax TaxID=256821 RepID=UPI0011B1D350|nr:hypothetical protein [Gulosibacter molinativorax]QUY61184.1 Hypotetical protein [Gulosibacter molinativorax]
MAELIPPSATGTPQHAGARDLSRWLVHLTRTPQDLASALTQGRIEARNPFGIAKNLEALLGNQKAVCFTETPLTELRRMTSRGRRWGVVFDKELLRERYGAQPVWYLSDPSPQWDAANQLLSQSLGPQRRPRDANDPYWKLTPFLDPVRPTGSDRPHDWRWEREWRVIGDVRFELSDISFIVWPEGNDLLWESDLTLGSLFVGHDGDEFWSGSLLEELDLKLDEMLETISNAYITVDDAGLPWDSEDQQYVAIVEILDAYDVVSEVFDDLPVAVLDALADALWRRNGDMWCRSSDLETIHE